MATKKTAPRKLALSVPPDVYGKLERIARARRTEPAGAATALLRRAVGEVEFVSGMGQEHVEAWKRAFAPLTEEEMLLVDGILMSDATRQ
jgi:hypothetical protein